ncbi:MAG TPA: PIG-L deacetylase family protein [Acidimicrobiales bacterium]|nr:PIG-L deacetylase family protein [Acidimicrobiales bacterium]
MAGIATEAGLDVTHESARRSCVVLAPHPDDETLGAGATIMRKIGAGTAVHVVVATDGSKAPPGDPVEVAALRRAELAEAGRILGLGPEDVTQLGFVDGTLDPGDDALVEAVAAVVAARRPAEVLVTGDSDPHADHAALFRATVRALGRAAWPARLLVYPLWQFGQPDLLRRMCRQSPPELVSTEGYRQRKRRAVAAYRSQLAVDDADEEGLRPSFLTLFDTPWEVFFPVSVPGAPAPG